MLRNLHNLLPHKDVNIYKRILFWILTLGIGFFLLCIIVFAGAVTILSIGLPDINDLENLAAAQSTEIFDRNGNLIYTIHGEENREYVTYDKISKYLVDATVAIEDDTFWEHGGFDIFAIAKAGLYEVFGIGSPRGGSTITQQYVKNTFLSPERSYIRKAKELILAIRLERAYTKEEIMELYLNRIPYGNNAYGAEKAAEVYFNKNAKDLDLAECVILAALPQAPTRYNPYGENKYSHLLKTFSEEELLYRNIEEESDLEIEEYIRGILGNYVDLGNGQTIYIQGRADLVLKRMEELGTITREERTAAVNELQKIEFNKYKEKIKYPHFVFFIKQQLEEKYGKDIVERGGLKVYTTLDPELQDYAEKMSEEYGETNAKTYEANNNGIITIDAKTGEILVMVGSRDYYNEEIDGNVNVVLSPRQPGSSFKPIVYAQAFYNGYGPGSVTYDIPTKIGPDRPSDFDGKWNGQVTIREALGKSRNIPAVQAYFLAGEQDPIIDLAEKMGITSLNKSHNYGYPLALGAGEVPLIELVNAYSVFATNGKKPDLTGILKIENANGDIIEEWRPKEFEEVLDPQIAYLINSILSDQTASIGPKIFVPGKLNAAKTGTSTKENKKEAKGAVRPCDNLTIEYTPSIITGVWVGNTNGSGLGYYADGYNTAAPIATAIMTKALEGKSSEPFPEPEGIKHIKISKASGKLPGASTPASMIVEEVFPSFSVPTEEEHIFFKVKIDKISGLLATEYTPKDATIEAVYQNYEPIADLFNWANEIKNYYQGQSAEGEGGIHVGLPPTEYDNIHTAETALKSPSITITSPASQSVLPQGPLLTEVSLSAPHGIKTVEFYLDDKKEHSTATAPYTGHLNISRFLAPGTRHLIVAKVIDILGYSAQSAIEIKVESPTPTPSN